MDEDYDYYQNTGESPEELGDLGQNNGCFWLIVICFIVIVCIWTCDDENVSYNQSPQSSFVEQIGQTSTYEPICISSETIKPETIQTEPPSVEEAKPAQSQLVIPQETDKHSTLYDVGYEDGYNDGEEDAYTHSGWQTTFDDDCKYSGKKKKEYEEGYEDGYEAGYNDNLDDYDD